MTDPGSLVETEDLGTRYDRGPPMTSDVLARWRKVSGEDPLFIIMCEIFYSLQNSPS